MVYRLTLLALMLLLSFSVAAQGDACPKTQFPDGGLGQVTPGSANRVRSAPSASAPLIGSLSGGEVFEVVLLDFNAMQWQEPTCADGFLWLAVHGQGIRGWTAERAISGGEPFLVPYEEIAPVEVGVRLDDGSLHIETPGLSFTLPPGLDIQRVTMQPQVGPLQVGSPCAYPNAILFTFDDSWHHYLRVLPFAFNEAIYQTYWKAQEAEETQLEALLRDKPDLLSFHREQGLRTIATQCGAASLFKASPRYQSFQGGEGLRYLTMMAQMEVFFEPEGYGYEYFFAGLSADRQWLVEMRVPLKAVPEDAIPPLPDDIERGYLPYLRQFEASLSAQPDDAFQPDLSLYDQVIASLILGPAEAILDMLP
jgi:hypothetical protein